MKIPTMIVCAVAALLFLVAALGIFWYNQPAKIEDLNRFAYCACGYSEVKFKDGVITMVRTHHSSPKPGDVIGRYKVTDDTVALTLTFNGKSQDRTAKINHLGIVDEDLIGPPYLAINGKSWKTYIYFLRKRMEGWFS